MNPEERNATIIAMTTHGGNFVRKLAALWAAADDDHSARIEATWPDLIRNYRVVAAQTKEAA